MAIADTVTSIVLQDTGTLTSIAGGWQGRRIAVLPNGNDTLSIAHASGSAGNQIATPGSVTYTQARGGALLEYETTGGTGTWRFAGTVMPSLEGDRGDITVSGLTWTIDSGAVTLAKMADLAQSRIIGRAEGAGTGVPQPLTPTQVVSIIDAENISWTGNHSFTSTTFDANTTGDLRLGATSGVGLYAGTTPGSVSTGTILLDASGDLELNAANDILLDAADTVDLTAGTVVRVLSAFALDSVISPSALTADQNNYSPTGWATANAVRLSTDGTAATVRDITGAAAGTDGEIKYLINLGPGDIRLQHEHASSSAANRFRFASLTTFTLDPEDMAGIWYDGDSGRWRAMWANPVS
ncbi:MAG TPA: hypothetical protein VGK73_05755 [Polyangiaceae bacterium]